MQKFKSLIALLFAALFAFGCVLPAAASNEGIMPAYSHCVMCSKSFYVSREGYATAVVDYVANDDTFTQAKITVRFQKRYVHLFWFNVDIGQPDNTWTVYSSNDRDIIEGAFPVSGAGTYRAIFYIEFYGTTGEIDVIEDTLHYDFQG